MRVRGELRAFRRIDHRHERFERRLVVEEIVFVDLVRSDHHFDRSVEVHPRHVAVAIVVGRKRVGKLRQVIAERPVRGQRRRFAQPRRGGIEKIPVKRRVGDTGEIGAVPTNDREESLQLVLLRGMRGDITLELLLRHVLGIESGAGRLRLRPDERLIILQPVPRTFVHDEVRVCVRRLRQLLGESRVVLRYLPPEDLVDLLRGSDEFRHDLPLVVVEQRMVVIDDRRRQLRDALGDVGRDHQAG